MKERTSLKIVLMALSTAIVAVFCLMVRIPVPATGGYVSLVDASVTFVAYAFGPVTGLVAGGVGTAVADLIGGYAQFSWISFIAHGIEGLLIGLIVTGVNTRLWRKILAAVVGTITMAGVYFIVTGLTLTTMSEALVEVVPNLIQGGVGSAIGLPLYLAVAKAYRGLDGLRLSLKKNHMEKELPNEGNGPAEAV